MSKVDYSLYLVTGRELVPKDKGYYKSLEEAIQGGVTLVQIREKSIETAEFLEIARRSQAICKAYNVPIIINDRIDIALAIGADGVHLGQTDMPIEVARRLLPKGTIIGISCNNLEHVQTAINQGADYIGIGAVYPTNTKKLTSPIVSVRGIGPLLQALDGTGVKAVAIGGINSKNALRVLHGAVSPTNHPLDGLAVVSDIMASPDPKAAAERLAKTIRAFRDGPAISKGLSTQTEKRELGSFLSAAASLLLVVRSQKPLVHQITNTVVANQSANVTLALGASPIMADSVEEMEDLSKINDALLVNIGTLRSGPKAAMLEAGIWNNIARKPVVLDPVGIGASRFRYQSAQEMLNLWAPSVIKGNAGELAAFAGSKEAKSKGVDSVGDGFKDPVHFVRELARKERCIIVLTGLVDYVSDGTNVIACRNGHKLLGDITGSGCILGSCVATFCAAASASVPHEQKRSGVLAEGDLLAAAVGGVLALTIASEHATAMPQVQGPGTLLSHLIDSLSSLTAEDILREAKIEIL